MGRFVCRPLQNHRVRKIRYGSHSKIRVSFVQAQLYPHPARAAFRQQGMQRMRRKCRIGMQLKRLVRMHDDGEIAANLECLHLEHPLQECDLG